MSAAHEIAPPAPGTSGAPRPGPFARGWQHLVALLLFVALALSLLWPAVAGDQVVSAAARWARVGPFPASQRALAPPGIDVLGDSANAYVPFLHYAADGWAADRRIPLWKTTACCGAPFVGNGESAVFFPTNLVAMLLGVPAWIHAGMAGAKIVAAAFFAYLLGRHLRLSFLAALLAGTVFGTGGFSMVFLLSTPTSVTLLLPLALLSVDRAVQRDTLPWLGAVAAIAGLQHLAGHPESVLHCQAAAYALGLLRLLSLRDRLGGLDVARRAGRLFAAFVAGAALAAVQILPLIEYIGESDALAMRERALRTTTFGPALPSLLFAAGLGLGCWAFVRLARGGRGTWATALVLLLSTTGGLLAGLKAGLSGAFMLPLASDWFGSIAGYVGPVNYLECNGAFAGSALVLAAAGLLFAPPRGLVRTCGVLLGLGLLVGFQAPVIAPLVQQLPLFDIAENTRLLVFALLATAVLAGLGLDALGQLVHEPARHARLLLATLVPAVAAWLAIPLAVATGLFPVIDEPRCPDGIVPIAARLLPLALESRVPAPGFPAPAEDDPAAARDDDGPTREFFGQMLLPAPPRAPRLLYGGRNASVALQWIAGSTDDPGQPPLADAPGLQSYLFRAQVPERALPAGDCRLRLRVPVDGTTLWSSVLVAERAGTPAWQAFPARPAPGLAASQLLELLAALVLVLLLLTARGRSLLPGRIALTGLCLASLWPFAAATIPLLPPALVYPTSPALELLSRLAPDGRMLTMRAANFPAEIPAVYGIPDVRGYDSLYPRRFAALLRQATDFPGNFTTLEQLPARPDPDLRLLGAMAVHYVTDWEQRPAGLQRLHVAGEELLPRTDPFPIVVDPDYLPRARLVTGATVEPDDERALALLIAPEFPLTTTVVLASGTDRPPSARPTRPAYIRKARPEIVDIEIEPAEPGWLVLADTFYPGWKVLVDGQERELLRANVAFRAVAVAPGDRVVEFRYEPFWFRAGVVISALTAAALLGACLLWPRLRARLRPRRGA